MPGFLLHVGAQVMCSHAGQAQPTVAISSPYVVAGCALPPPPAGNGPCVTAQFVTATTRVTSNGQPLLLLDSQAICTPTATPLIVVMTQTRATAM